MDGPNSGLDVSSSLSETADSLKAGLGFGATEVIRAR